MPLTHYAASQEPRVVVNKIGGQNGIGTESGRELTPDEEIELFENEIKKMREGEKDPQIVVKEEELVSYLKDGWQFVSVLPSQKILIRK